MIIPEKLINKWTALKTPGDAAKMAEKIEGGYTEMFYRAFREKKCSDEVFKVMADFYEDKVALIKEYL